MQVFNRPSQLEDSSRDRIKKAAIKLFAVAGFSHNTLMEPDASPQVMQEMAEGLAEIFLNGVLVKS